MNWATGPVGLASFAFFDLETTGLRPDRGAEITEIAVVDQDQLLLHWQAHVADASSFAGSLLLLLECLDSRVVVGHNLPFDFQFVAYEARRLELSMPQLRFTDTLSLARSILGPQQDARLEALLHRFDLLPEDPLHRALVDARATRALFWKLVDVGGLRTLAEAGVKPLTWTSP